MHDEEKLTTVGTACEIPENRQYVGHKSILVEEELNVVSVCTHRRSSIVITSSTLPSCPRPRHRLV